MSNRHLKHRDQLLLTLRRASVQLNVLAGHLSTDAPGARPQARGMAELTRALVELSTIGFLLADRIETAERIEESLLELVAEWRSQASLATELAGAALGGV